MSRAKKVKKTPKTKNAKKTKTSLLAQFRHELSTLDREVKVVNKRNEDLVDLLEERVDDLGDKIDEAENGGELTEQEAEELAKELDRLDDLL